MAAEASTEVPAQGKIDLGDIPAVIRCNDDHQRGVGSSSTSMPMSLDVDLDPSTQTASFRLRFALLQRGSNKTTPVFLLIDSQTIESIALCGSEQAPEGAATPPDCNKKCLRFMLSSLSKLIVPLDPLRLKDKTQQSVMRSVRSAARQSTLMVHIPDDVLSQEQLTALVEAPYQQFTSSRRHSDISRLYGGRGGKVLDVGAEDAPVDQPPSYNDVPVPPPMAPISYGMLSHSFILMTMALRDIDVIKARTPPILLQSVDESNRLMTMSTCL